MDRVDGNRVGISIAATLALINIVCAVAVAIWPTATIDFFGSFAHGLNLAPVQSTEAISIGRSALGVIGLAIIGYVAGVIFAWVYNLQGSR
jgi:hypothetical protein